MQKGTCCGLFDWSLEEYVTPSLLALLYKVAVLFAVLWGLCTFFGGLFGHTHWLWKIFVFVWAPVGTLLWIVFARICFETIKVVFTGAGIPVNGCCCGADAPMKEANEYVAPRRFAPHNEL